MANVKPCLYFDRGYCKHGSNCHFSHAGNHLSVSVSASSSPSRSVNEEPISTGSLERLELELQELLRAKRAPISIASLPQLYYERYGRTLQAEGYLLRIEVSPKYRDESHSRYNDPFFWILFSFENRHHCGLCLATVKTCTPTERRG